MTKLVELYAREVLAGNRKISEVPAKLREDVQKELEKQQSVGE